MGVDKVLVPRLFREDHHALWPGEVPHLCPVDQDNLICKGGGFGSAHINYNDSRTTTFGDLNMFEGGSPANGVSPP